MLTSVLLLFATAGQAAPAEPVGGYYSATPAAAPTRTSVVTRGVNWKFADGSFNAKRVADADAVMCQRLVQRVGAVSAFTAGGVAFNDAQLARCNAAAQ